MATMQQQRQQTNTWSTIFPTEQVTQQQSALFVKKLLAVAISNITYLRTIFPEHAFGDRCLEDLSLKILRDDSSCPGACQVIQWVKGCFDALEKQYLKTIVIGIYEDSADKSTAVETYTFKFGYNREEGVTIFRNGTKLTGAYSNTETRKATIKLLRTIVVLTQTLKPLPDDVMMTMKLYYYDEVTPSSYEPPGFQASTSEDFRFKERPMNIRVGDVDTPFHSVKLRIKTDCQQFAACDEEDASQKMEVEEEREAEKHENRSTEPQSLEKEEKEEEEMKPLPIAATAESEGKAAALPSMATSASQPPAENNHNEEKEEEKEEKEKKGATRRREGGERKRREGGGTRGGEGEEGREKNGGSEGVLPEENIVRCPCGCNEDDGLMVLCAHCNTWQHAVCFALLSEKDVPETHICVQCSHPQLSSDDDDDGGSLRCTDSFLQTLDPVTVQAACLWRRGIVASLEFSRVIPPSFAKRLGVAVSVAQGLVNRLEREGYVRVPMKNKKLGKIVNKDRIRMDGIRKYFENQARDGQVQSGSKDLERNGERGEDREKDKEMMKDVTNGTSSLSLTHSQLSGGGGGGGGVGNGTVAPSPQVTAIQVEDSESCGVRRSPRIVAARKRVRSAVDESVEFDISCSQDVENSYSTAAAADSDKQQKRRKRRKASIASRSILV